MSNPLTTTKKYSHKYFALWCVTKRSNGWNKKLSVFWLNPTILPLTDHMEERHFDKPNKYDKYDLIIKFITCVINKLNFIHETTLSNFLIFITLNSN